MDAGRRVWNHSWLRACAAGLIAVAASAPALGQRIVVFGDSLSDTGNVLAFSQTPLAAGLGFTPRPTAPWYEPGQFTNGVTGGAGLRATRFTQGSWVNVFADRLGTARPAASGLAPDTAPTGSNFAWGGAQASEGSLLPPVATQVGFYLSASAQPGTTIPRSPDTIHAFWLGGNDLLNAARASGATPASVAAAGNAAMAAMRESIQTLVDAAGSSGGGGGSGGGQGRVRVLWANVPSLDRTPLGASLPLDVRTALRDASVAFRAQQGVEAALLRAANPGLELATLDVFGVFEEVLADPAAFGVENVTTPILATTDFTVPGPFSPTLNVGLDADPDRYAFWDDLHPTARMHALIGERAAMVIPAPGVAGLLALGGWVVIARRRR
jgi:phospholipase/lecithinase/hemolysin